MRFLLLILMLIATSALTYGQTTLPLVKNMDRPYNATSGLEGRHIAMWHSHGLYYELANARWEWQRARLFQTVEDIFPGSFVLPYVVPMLENAGATVLIPRERDTNSKEIIVDNDMQLATSPYKEVDGTNAWEAGEGNGFGYVKSVYKDFENPFKDGTYRMAKATSSADEASQISWEPIIPEDDKYAVYVSYKTLSNSVEDAQYTVFHAGGSTRFQVNQKMGGGTWIYLGTFSFKKDGGAKVVLSNVSGNPDGIVTADGVKFGGGLGNIARKADGSLIYDNTKKKKDKAGTTRRTTSPIVEYQYETSGYPRYTEAARYFLQWAGIPDSIYSPSHGTNDYTDDYKCRGKWVNYLAGGSTMLPKRKGLNIPVDLSFAFHTDGGTVAGNNTIGTLGIYQTTANNGKFGNGKSRTANKLLCNTVCNSIVNDIRALVEPEWNFRGTVDKSYSEASTPQMPSMLLELMSHESFAEMRYGLDPRFRFIVSRAIYKGILKFMSQQYGFDYVVQPLPVKNFSALFCDSNKVELFWDAVADTLEATAVPDRYVVYTRIGDGDFDNGTVVNTNSCICTVPSDQIVSFKITALNDGGQSMPSEILSVGYCSTSKNKPVLVINGFDRISAPDDFTTSDDTTAGFLADKDNGVGYGVQFDYIGKMKEFRRSIPWTDDDSPGFGDSYGNYETKLVAGNTFDYPYIHGQSIMKAGYSFASISRSAISELVPMAQDSTLCQEFSAIDLILGKQKQSKLGRLDINPIQFKTFDENMQSLLTAYCKNGGNVFVSGSYVATDLWQNPVANSIESDKLFASQILKYQWRDDCAATDGKVKYTQSPLANGGLEFDYYNKPNSNSYAVESPDAIIPVGNNSFTAFRYSENKQGAGIAFGSTKTEPWKTVVLAFPFESIKDPSIRNNMMKNILMYFNLGKQQH